MSCMVLLRISIGVRPFFLERSTLEAAQIGGLGGELLDLSADGGRSTMRRFRFQGTEEILYRRIRVGAAGENGKRIGWSK